MAWRPASAALGLAAARRKAWDSVLARGKWPHFENGDVPAFAGLMGTKEQIVERLKQYEAIGIQEV